MRFQIQDAPFWGRANYNIHLGALTIPVHNPPLLRQLRGRERIVFTWPDSGECTVAGPNPPNDAIEIVSPAGMVWSGFPVDPRLREKLARPEIFSWHREGQLITCEVSRLCCRRVFPISLVLTLRNRDGSRLATWFVYRPRQGSMREDLPEDMKAVVLGMVLSTMYDFGPSTSD
jgi:hypothetical protein